MAFFLCSFGTEKGSMDVLWITRDVITAFSGTELVARVDVAECREGADWMAASESGQGLVLSCFHCSLGRSSVVSEWMDVARAPK